MAAITAEPAAPATPAPATPEPSIAPAPEPSQDWRAILTDEGLKKDATLARYKTADDAGKALIEQHKALSSVITKIPGKDAKPEEIQAFREKLGVPKDPTGYDLSPIKGLPVDEGKMGQILPVFHQVGLTNEQATTLAARFYEVEQRWKEQEREAHYQAHDKLADEWGKLVYDTRLQKVQRLVKKYADADTIEWMNRTGADVHPGLFKMLLPIAEQFSEDGFIDGESPGSGSTLSEVTAKVNDIRARMLKAERGSDEYRALFAELEKYNALEADLARQK